MGLFGRSKRPAARKAPARLVAVAYRPFSHDGTPDWSPTGGYVYKWAVDVAPHVGMKVHAPVAISDDQPAIIIACDPPLPKGYTRATLSTITRLPTRRELK